MRANNGTFDDCCRQAEQGADDAQYRLGLMLSTGQQGTPLDYVTAHMWLNLAAMKGHAAARERRREISFDMSKVEIAEAQRRARKWIETRH